MGDASASLTGGKIILISTSIGGGVSSSDVVFVHSKFISPVFIVLYCWNVIPVNMKKSIYVMQVPFYYNCIQTIIISAVSNLHVSVLSIQCVTLIQFFFFFFLKTSYLYHICNDSIVHNHHMPRHDAAQWHYHYTIYNTQYLSVMILTLDIWLVRVDDQTFLYIQYDIWHWLLISLSNN